jgi:multiple sugar transport system permease protein
MQMLLKIFIPVALPGIIAATIFAFTVSWAQFVYPMAFLYNSDQQVLTVGRRTETWSGGPWSRRDQAARAARE